MKRYARQTSDASYRRATKSDTNASRLTIVAGRRRSEARPIAHEISSVGWLSAGERYVDGLRSSKSSRQRGLPRSEWASALRKISTFLEYTSPPEGPVICALRYMVENAAISPKVPTGFALCRAKCAWLQSSITLIPC